MNSTLSCNTKSSYRKGQNIVRSNRCYQCGFAFVQENELRRHLKAHSGEKSYKCHKCDYASVQAGNLKQHLKTHDVKSYKCNQCDFASVRESSLKAHLRTQPEGKTYDCNQYI